MSVISFARGIPGPDLLPTAEFGECARRAAAQDGARALNYGPPSGYPPLRDWVAKRHGVAPERVVLTTGSLQGFNFLARHALSLDATVLVEAPCYDRSLAILRRLGLKAESIPLREDGIDLDALADALAGISGAKLVYTIPTFQNPSGRTLSRESRLRLLTLVRDAGALVLEDDPYGLLRFVGEPLPTLFELGAGDGVVFLSSFSKTVAPGIRVGYLVLPDALVPAVEGFVLENYVSPSVFVQAALHEFIAGGFFEPGVARIRDGLRLRRDAMLAALSRELPRGARWNEPAGGYFLWLELPTGVDAATVLAAAAAVDVTFVPGPDFYFGEGGEEAVRLAFSFASAPEIGEGISRLAGLVSEAAAVAA
ncbi:MAG: PLP-dependent aminotransferase family protein [Thermoleophilia bacterium]|nr:PLP-dependent aminotransferase family protein [Thermoleophilia bacterium]